MPEPRFDHNACRAAIAELRERFGESIQTGEEICRQHAHTLTWITGEPPDAVVFASSTEDVADVVAIAAQYEIPIIPFGAGTSLEGHVNAPYGVISLDLSRMDEILRVDTGDLDCTVQAGVSRGKLNAYLRDTGLYFPIDPGTEEATIGGMASTRASGTTAVRYGTMRENVIAVKAVMASGEIINTASRARKSSAGYDLTRLLVGSEGTLGIITEVTLRLRGIPEHVVSSIAAFPTLEAACNATMAAMALGLGVARIELLDPVVLGAVNAHSKLELEEAPTLFIEFHGSESAVMEEAATFAELAEAEGVLSVTSATHESERRRLWKARHDSLWAVGEAWPGRRAVITDVCVPISRLAECVAETQSDIRDDNLIAPIVGHVGDGNFHAIIMHDPDDGAERGRIEAFSARLAERAIGMEGTCTGEHGIGQGKMKLLRAELGAGVEVLRGIKQALDPQGILNPGKIVYER